MRVIPFGQELAVFTRRRRASAASSVLMLGLGLGTYSKDVVSRDQSARGLGREGNIKYCLHPDHQI
jgi:hypothetical protein